MKRKVEQILEKWKEREHLPLVIRGPRQVGKTYSIRQFARNHYNTVLEFNFEDMPEQKKIFSGNLDAKSIYERLSVTYPTIRFDKDCLIFMDEIQACPGAESALKPLAQDGRCDIICSGSMLGHTLGSNNAERKNERAKIRLFPLGYIEEYRMSPMDFEEFLWALGYSPEQTRTIGNHIRQMIPMDDFILSRITNLFKRYVTVGGMPAAVEAYSKNNLYGDAYNVLTGLYSKIVEDSLRYASSNGEKAKILACLKSIPGQISAENNNSFVYAKIEGIVGNGQREYGPALTWLENAGIIDFCNNVQGVYEPFVLKTDGNTFKIYMKDTGVMVMLLGLQGSLGVMGAAKCDNGAVMENAVFECLVRKGYTVYYHSNTQARKEIDFVLNINGKLSVIEVKSGRKKRATSLKKLMEADRNLTGIKVSNSNLFIDEDGIRHYPLFGPCFFEDARLPEIPPPDYIEELKSRLDADPVRDLQDA